MIDYTSHTATCSHEAGHADVALMCGINPYGITVKRWRGFRDLTVSSSGSFGWLIACGGAACEIQLVSEQRLCAPDGQLSDFKAYTGTPLTGSYGDVQAFKLPWDQHESFKETLIRFVIYSRQMAKFLDLDFIGNLTRLIEAKVMLQNSQIYSYEQMAAIRDQPDIASLIAKLAPHCSVDRDPRDPYGRPL